jgi:biopolymer transport protein ExbB
MKKLMTLLTIIVGIAVAGTAFAAAQQAAKGPTAAHTLEQLLHQVQHQQNAQAQVNKQRVQRFEQQRNKQKQILAKAKDQLNAAKAQGKKLQSTFDANEKALDKLTSELHSREGNLGEAFGVVRQVAGSVKGTVSNSLISAQLPNSAQQQKFLSKLSNAQTLPSIKQLERLWYIMQQQMTMQGQIAKFPTTITQPDGTKQKTQVVRVGAFNAIQGNDFLRFLPQTGSLVVLPRQPASRFRSMAQNLYTAKPGSGPIKMAVDPTSGSLLGLLIQKPTLGQYISYGQSVGYVIIALGIIGILLIIERAIALGIVGRKVKSQVKDPDQPRKNNPLGRVLGIYNTNRADDPETLELKLDEAVMRETPKIEARLYIIKLIAAIAPLLGLLGTVIGMVVTFQAITLHGTGNPKLMANGISEALITTVLGLVVAIPLVLLHGLVSRRSRSIVEILEQQSTGMVAERAERAREEGDTPAGGGTARATRGRPVSGEATEEPASSSLKSGAH